jgi:hypothetical protein
VVAWSGFYYHAADKALTLSPKTNTPAFTSFWSTTAGWGLFSVAPENKRSRTKITVAEGTLPLRTIRCGKATVTLDEDTVIKPGDHFDVLV